MLSQVRATSRPKNVCLKIKNDKNAAQGLHCKFVFKVYMGCHMAKVSISQAAKLAGISRTALYKSYINKGLLSTSRDEAGKKYIDISEILRVFGKLKADTVDSVNSI